MALFKRAGDDRTMLEHVKSLMACDKKGGFALVADHPGREGVDWVPLTCLEEVRVRIQEMYTKVPEGDISSSVTISVTVKVHDHFLCRDRCEQAPCRHRPHAPAQ